MHGISCMSARTVRAQTALRASAQHLLSLRRHTAGSHGPGEQRRRGYNLAGLGAGHSFGALPCNRRQEGMHTISLAARALGVVLPQTAAGCGAQACQATRSRRRRVCAPRCSVTAATGRQRFSPQPAQTCQPLGLPAELLLACGRPGLSRRRASF